EKGQVQAAKNILDALINEIKAQGEKHIAQSAASTFIADAQTLKESL
ncbi:MAG: hypothetical protein HY401_03535, partial [Elusimicrobia bacterium]|nr:hypothetical protein [Elusimicrobiota bacterium]